MDSIDSEGYRENVGIILTDGAGSVLLAGRLGRSGWQFPQGGVAAEESAEEAMYRELHEEIGLTHADVSVLGCTPDWLRYRLPDQFVRRNSTPLCIGQKQRWFMLKLEAPESHVRFDATSKPEFDRWRWVDYWRPVKEVIYFKRHVYVQALDQLGPLVFPGGVPPRPRWWPRQWHGGSGRGESA
jgi:putative (di)nucleoside polyphosphate hydrolase